MKDYTKLNMKNFSLILFLLFIFSFYGYSQKRVMTIDDLKTWNTVSNEKISTNGNWVTYQIAPNKGDANLFLYDYSKNSYKKIERGFDAVLGYDNNFLVYKIKVQEDTLKKKKLAKVKADKLPKDSLGIYFFDKDTTIKIEKIKSYFLPEKSSQWFAYLYDFKETKPKDTLQKTQDTLAKAEQKKQVKNEKKNEHKQDGQRLVIFNAIDFSSYTFDNVEFVAVSEKAERFAFIINKNDSIDTASVYLFDTKLAKKSLIFQKSGKAVGLTLDKKGLQTAFLFSSDTIKEKRYTLIYNKLNQNIITLVDTVSKVFKKNWGVSEYQEPYFSDAGNLLYFGVAQFPKPQPKDTLLENEKVSVDIWNWKDKVLQSQQLVDLEIDKKKSFLSVYQILSAKIIPLEDSLLRIKVNKKVEPKFYFAKSELPYFEISSWDVSSYADYYLIDAKTGAKRLIDNKKSWQVYTSPSGKWFLFWDYFDENWKLFDAEFLKYSNLTEKVNDVFVDDEQDVPSVRRSHGFVGWSENEEFIYINSKFDIWRFSTRGDKIPKNLTTGEGKNTKKVFRFRKLDLDAIYLPSDSWLLNSVNKETMTESFEFFNLGYIQYTNLYT